MNEMRADGQCGGLNVLRLDVDRAILVPKAGHAERAERQRRGKSKRQQSGEAASDVSLLGHCRLLSHSADTMVTSSCVEVSKRTRISSLPARSYSPAVTSSKLVMSSVR